MELTKSMRYLSWFLRIVAAVILLQTLFFKFTGAAESVYIFSTLGMEPWGRIGSGVAELCDELRSGILLQTVHKDLTSFGHNAAGDRGSYAERAAGDDDGFVFESHGAISEAELRDIAYPGGAWV